MVHSPTKHEPLKDQQSKDILEGTAYMKVKLQLIWGVQTWGVSAKCT